MEISILFSQLLSFDAHKYGNLFEDHSKFIERTIGVLNLREISKIHVINELYKDLK